MAPRNSHIHVLHGDIARLQCDAIVFPTGAGQRSRGLVYQSLARFVPGFEQAYAAQRRPFGDDDAYWIDLDTPDPAHPQRRVRGVVVAKIVDKRVSGTTHRSVGRVIAPAVRLCARHLAQPRVLLAFPCLGTGKGSVGKPSSLAEEQLRAAAEALTEWELAGDGTAQSMDLLMVAYDRPAFHRLLAARATIRHLLGSAWPCVEIEDDPELQALAHFIRREEAVLFVGSGLSAGAGLPSWWDLIIRLLRELPEEVQATYRHPSGTWKNLTFDDFLDIASWHWLVHQDAQANDQTQRIRDHRQHIRELFSDHATRHVHPTLAHYHLLAMPWHYIVTTNYDVMLERTLEAQRQPLQVVVTDDEIPRAGGRALTTVIKFHGHAADPSSPCDSEAHHDHSIVLTRDEYEHFFDRNPAKALLLEALLLNHHFFFYGYSLSDFDLRMIYHRVGQMLRCERREAYAASLERTHAPKRQFWMRRGMHLIEMEGDGIDARELDLLRWLDALVEAATANAAPFLSEPSLDGQRWQGFERVHHLARALARELVQLVIYPQAASPAPWQPAQVQTFERFFDLLASLGWRPEPDTDWNSIWRALATGQDPEARARLLLKAAAAATSLEALLATRVEMATEPEQA